MRMLGAHKNHTLLIRTSTVHYPNMQFKSLIWEKVFSQKNCTAQILVCEITYNEDTKLKTKQKFGNNGADTCSRQGRTLVLPEARILFLNALSDRRISDDKMAGLQLRREQHSHSQSHSHSHSHTLNQFEVQYCTSAVDHCTFTMCPCWIIKYLLLCTNTAIVST
jgi:hypothetical protein